MLLVCGEALVDLVPASIGRQSGYLARGGGSPYNVAVALGRLGIPVGFLGRLSTDHFGQMLRDRLAENGVDLTYVRQGSEPTALAVVHLEPGEDPQFAFYGDRTADRLLRPADLAVEFSDRVTTVHFGSISLVREPGASLLAACMRREHALGRVVSLDPNVRPSLIDDRDAYLRKLDGWLPLTDIVKVSRADLTWLYPEEAPAEVAARWLVMGPSLVVVTLGHDGATGFRSGSAITVPAVSIEVVDTVGGGDAFTAGLLARLYETHTLDRRSLAEMAPSTVEQCLEQANRVAALTCMQSGAEPPARSELDAFQVR